MASTGTATELVIQGQHYDYRYANDLAGPTGAELTGHGTITLSDNANNAIVGSSPFFCEGLCYPAGPAAQLINDDNLIQGGGTIGSVAGGGVSQLLTLINHGTVDANVSNPLYLNLSGPNTDDGVMEASNGGTLIFASGAIDNTGGTVQALDGSTVILSGGTVNNGLITAALGGTVDLANGSSTGAVLVSASGGLIKLDGATISNAQLSGPGEFMATGGYVSDSTIEAGSALTVVDGGSLTLAGTITNEGLITLASVGTATQLIVQGQRVNYYGALAGPTGAELTGHGTITLSDNANNAIVGSSPFFCEGLCYPAGPAAQLINDDNLIQGAGTIGGGGVGQLLTLINQGTIDANASNPLYLNLSGPNANNGLIEATNGGTLVFQGGMIDNTGGVIQAADGSIVSFQGGSVDNGLITARLGGVVDLMYGAVDGAQLASDAGGLLKLDGTTISNAQLSGPGAFAAYGSSLNDSTISSGSSLTLADGGSLILAGTITNQGLITLASTGTATELVIQGQHYDYRYANDLAGPTGAELTGHGTITLSDNANNAIVGSSPFFCEGLCYPAGPAAQLINDDNLIQGAGTIGGGGVGQLLTLINHGTIDANSGNPLTLNLSGPSTNDGTMQASNGGTLIFASGALDNTGGVIQALDGSTVVLGGGTVNNGLITAASGGTVDMSGGTSANAQLVSASGGVVKLDGTAISNTQLSGPGAFAAYGSSLNNSTISSGSSLTLADGGTLTLAGTITNQGLITLASTGTATQLIVQGQRVNYYGALAGPTGAELTGHGTITLSDNANNAIVGSSPFFCEGLCYPAGPAAQLINDDNLIQGAGTIGGGGVGQLLTLINHGTIDANSGNPLTLNLSGPSTNEGTMQASNGGTLIFASGAIDNTGGVIQALDGSTVSFRGSSLSNLQGSTLTSGSYKVEGLQSAATLDLDAAIVTNQASVVVSGRLATFTSLAPISSNAGVLQFDSGAQFTTLGDFTNTGTLRILGEQSAFNVNGNFSQSAGLTLINGGEISVSGLLNVSGGSFGGQGTVQGAVDVSDGVLQVGASPDALTIAGAFDQTGGTVRFEVYEEPNGLFETDTLILEDPLTSNISGAKVIFDFVGAANPEDFFKTGDFSLQTFVDLSGGTDPAGLSRIFAGDQYEITSDDFQVRKFVFSAADGAEQLQIAPAGSVPEPGTWMILIEGAALLGGALRTVRRRRQSCRALLA